MEALQWAFGVRKIVQKCAYVQKISLPQNLKYDFFFPSLITILLQLQRFQLKVD